MQAISEPIGQTLKKEREERNLSLEDVAHETKIRPDRLYDLENDDYSNFPNPTYARYFFRLYCKYLDVEPTEEVEMLLAGSMAGMDDYEYIRANQTPRSKRLQKTKKSLTFIASAAVFVLLVAIIFALSLVWTFRQVGSYVDRQAQPQAAAEKSNATAPTLPQQAEQPPAIAKALKALPSETGTLSNGFGIVSAPATTLPLQRDRFLPPRRVDPGELRLGQLGAINPETFDLPELDKKANSSPPVEE